MRITHFSTYTLYFTLSLEQCGSFSLTNDNYSKCKMTNWIFNIVPSDDFLWTISPGINRDEVFIIDSYGGLSLGVANAFLGVSPAVYLTSDIILTGDGTEGNPFQIMA